MKQYLRSAAAFLLLLCMAAVVGGCTKDSLLGIYNRALQATGDNVLTSSLQGDRQFGSDSYCGTYQAELKDATAREYLFGGTSIERDDGYDLKVQADFYVLEGSAALILKHGADDPETLFDGSGHFETELELGPGSDYFILDVSGCTGSVSVTVE